MKKTIGPCPSETSGIRIIRMVHFMKKEILEKNKKDSKLIIMDYAGMLENLTDDESDRFNEAVKRKSLFRDEYGEFVDHWERLEGGNEGT
jgi:hypothetical protein